MTDKANNAMHYDATEIELDPLSATTPSGMSVVDSMLPLLGSVRVRVTVRVGAAQLSVAELLELKPGSTLTLDRHADAPLDVLVDGGVVARGVLVAVGEHFGLRITQTAVASAGAVSPR
ncbi:flagellar motor switch protein FliN/FliY [Povalibacter uvarum]|uniref:Flagellar motor switch protein FliN n=1 Tax=Povalibacter uvarum TaxID=732238 RepID=A0A841HFQ1_9GAMM|nr:FliM/FliN family flagellar motor C-terminal domain-containing protein [Povalibacter uvarum]MBB6091180.1 flagellar motor switch protein FliN/FliY [Povalibacter uvarum]